MAKKNRKQKRLKRKNNKLNNIKKVSQQSVQTSTPKGTRITKQEKGIENTNIKNDDNNLMPRNIIMEYDENTDETNIIDTETGELLDTFNNKRYTHNNEYRSEYRKFHEQFFENTMEGNLTFANVVIDTFYQDIQKLPKPILRRINNLFNQVAIEQGADQLAYALLSCEDIWEISKSLEFASDKVAQEFSTQFLNYLPQASDRWIKDTMEEFEYNEGIYDDEW